MGFHGQAGLGFVGGPSRSDEDFGGSDGGDSFEGPGGSGGGGGSDERSVGGFGGGDILKFCSCSYPAWAVILNFGSLLQHDAMTYCQFPHGCRVPSM